MLTPLLTGIPQCRINEMENGKRPIGKEIAKRLEGDLNIGYMGYHAPWLK
ncbi:MAG: hypothetical protein WCW53_12450 [Syntrophales bacterium]